MVSSQIVEVWGRPALPNLRKSRDVHAVPSSFIIPGSFVVENYSFFLEPFEAKC